MNRARVTWPDGYAMRYEHDALGHLTAATDSGGTVLASHTYDDLARPATVQYPSANDNIATTVSAEDDLVTMTNNFAAAANDVSYTNSFSPAHQWTSSGISNAAFRYVPTQSGSDVYGAVNGLNQYAAMTPNGAGAQSLTYDLRGNLTGDGVLTLAYDPENHLMTAAKTGMSATYRYDPLGRRKTKTVNGTATNFLHDGDTEIAEYDGSGALLRRFVPGAAIDQPIAMVTAAGVKTLFHTDKMGSVVTMSNATDGHLAEGPYTYDEYDNCVSGGSPCGSGVPFRYTGQRFDPETGLYHYRARCYSPSLGRFCQTDPVGYKDGLNLYIYVHDDPTDKTDPRGLDAELRWTAPNAVEYDVPYYIDTSASRAGFTPAGVNASVAHNFSGTVRLNGGVTVTMTAKAILEPRPGPGVNVITVLPTTRGVTRSGRAETNVIGGNKITVGASDNADTAAHEVGGHAGGAGDQYAGGVDRHGNILNSDVAGAPNIMRDYGGPANQQTLHEILGGPTTTNKCSPKVHAANGGC